MHYPNSAFSFCRDDAVRASAHDNTIPFGNSPAGTDDAVRASAHDNTIPLGNSPAGTDDAVRASAHDNTIPLGKRAYPVADTRSGPP